MFKKGEKVYSLTSGWGEVVYIEDTSHRPIVCTFNNGDAERFHYDGKANSYDKVATLYKKEMLIVEK
jgi:hypothetical protein